MLKSGPFNGQLFIYLSHSVHDFFYLINWFCIREFIPVFHWWWFFFVYNDFWIFVFSNASNVYSVKSIYIEHLCDNVWYSCVFYFSVCVDTYNCIELCLWWPVFVIFILSCVKDRRLKVKTELFVISARTLRLTRDLFSKNRELFLFLFFYRSIYD